MLDDYDRAKADRILHRPQVSPSPVCEKQALEQVLLGEMQHAAAAHCSPPSYQAASIPAAKQPLASRKASGKRRLSPADPMSSEGELQPKRKVTNPLLILVQSQVEGELGALEEQYNNLVRDSSTREGISRQDSDPTPTYDEVPADVFGSQESENQSFHQEPDSLADPSSSSLTTFSSSYTSWTRPLAGHRVSDSCAPASSILDVPASPMPPPPPPTSLHLSRRRSRPSRRSKRDSSADTSKDIDDIEDFDFDDDDSDEGSYEVDNVKESKKNHEELGWERRHHQQGKQSSGQIWEGPP